MRGFAAGLALALSITMPTTGWAQKPTVQQQRVACTPDAFRLCSHEIPNLSRIIQCLRENRANLSAACGKIFDALEPRSRAATRSTSKDGGVDPFWCSPKRAREPPPDVWSAWCEEAGTGR